ncbi:hypothetical protein [Pseudomonas jessenii]|jgi:hypothetical protein
MSKNIKAVPTSEYNTVIATANQYVEGLRIEHGSDSVESRLTK